MATAQRLDLVRNHLTPDGNSKDSSAAVHRLLEKLPDDIVITCAVRTPITKGFKGGFKDTQMDDLLASILKALREKSGINPDLVEDVCVGNVLRPGAAGVARLATMAAGFPVTTPCSVASRMCSSGLLAIQTIATAIANGSIDIGIAAGAESMSSNPDKGAASVSDGLMVHPQAQDALMPVGWTSENVAEQFEISREAQDKFAASSFAKAENAQKQGWFDDEIVPVHTTWKDKEHKIQHITVSRDDGIRYGTSAETLGKIKPAFPKWPPSTTTGGNASQIADGAAAVLLMKRSTAERIGQRIIGKYVQSTVVGLDPRIMGIGPVYAIPKLLQKVGIKKSDVDVFEINEAFATAGLYAIKKLELDPSKVNPCGGAIALGHPLGCTGVRQVVTALSELRRSKAKIAVTSMCVGSGMGMAGLIVLEN